MQETNNAHTTPSPRSEISRDAVWGSALDRAFPSPWLIGGLIFFVVVLSVLSGWKIVNLGRERAILDSERKLLERDKKAYSSILKDLPQMEQKKQALQTALADLQGQVDALNIRSKSLRIKTQSTREELERAKAERTETVEAASAARKEYTKLHGMIETARGQLPTLQQQVADLKEQRETLWKNTIRLQTQDSSLQADIQGLEEKRLNKETILKQMTQDTGVLYSLSKKFEQIYRDLERSRKNADSAVQGLNNQSQQLSKAIENVSFQGNALSSQVQGISGETKNLSSIAQSINNTDKTVKQVSKTLQTGGTSLDTAVNQLNTASQSIQNKAENFTITMNGSLQKIQTNLDTFQSKVGLLGSITEKLNAFAITLQQKTSGPSIIHGASTKK